MGAGLTAACSALLLQQQGRSVARVKVVDSLKPARLDIASTWCSLQPVGPMLELSLSGIAAYRHIWSRLGKPSCLLQRGSVIFATTPTHTLGLQSFVSSRTIDGLAMRLVTGPEAMYSYPMLPEETMAAAAFEADLQLDLAALEDAIENVLKSAGVQTFTAASLDDLSPWGGSFTISTNQGEIRGGKVLVIGSEPTFVQPEKVAGSGVGKSSDGQPRLLNHPWRIGFGSFSDCLIEQSKLEATNVMNSTASRSNRQTLWQHTKNFLREITQHPLRRSFGAAVSPCKSSYLKSSVFADATAVQCEVAPLSAPYCQSYVGYSDVVVAGGGCDVSHIAGLAVNATNILLGEHPAVQLPRRTSLCTVLPLRGLLDAHPARIPWIG